MLSNVIQDFNGKEIVFQTFYEKELLETNQTKFKVEKVIKRKGGKLYIKCKGCNKLLTSCIDKKIPLYEVSYFLELYTHGKNKIKSWIIFGKICNKIWLKELKRC